MALFSKLAFEVSVHELRTLPPTHREIAFAGRSNAGKSSAINTLANRKLAFTSKTPGRTQLLNFFRIQDNDFLVDLPGYGYAEVPAPIRKHWEDTLAAYLQTRGALVGLVLIMDARHPLTKLDVQMLDWFTPTGRPVHVLLTKSDKLTRQQATNTLATVRKTLATDYPNCTAQLFSSSKKTGVDEAESVLSHWLA